MSIAQGAKVVAIILTRDVAKAKPFYIGVLGFPLIADDGLATVVDLNGIALRITEIPDHTPVPHAVLGWEVPDIAAAIAALKARVAWFFDPDGNNLSLTQRVRVGRSSCAGWRHRAPLFTEARGVRRSRHAEQHAERQPRSG